MADAVAKALDKIKRATGNDDRTEAVREFAELPDLNSEDFRKLLAMVGDMPDDARGNVLMALSARFPRDVLREAMMVACKIEKDEPFASTIAALAQQLKGSTWRQIANFLAKHSFRHRIFFVVSLLLVVLAAGGLAWLCWFVWMPRLNAWGFSEFSWKSIVAAVGWFYLAIGPFFPLFAMRLVVDFWTQYGEVHSQVAKAREAQEEIEKELLQGDKQRLILLLRYSRKMLSEYYTIATHQAQRSFRYCLVAMWIGFIVLMAGALDLVRPLREGLAGGFHDAAPAAGKTDPSKQSSGSVSTTTRGLEAVRNAAAAPDNLAVLTGLIIEFIAAAFLWVYRFSIEQQTYYYRRQLRLHNALMAYRLTEAMGTARDEATQKIVERLLEDPDTPKAKEPSSSGVAALLGKLRSGGDSKTADAGAPS